MFAIELFSNFIKNIRYKTRFLNLILSHWDEIKLMNTSGAHLVKFILLGSHKLCYCMGY